MILFAKESLYVTAANKILFWIAIFANILFGILMMAGKVGVGDEQIDAYYPLALTIGLVMIFCAVAMISVLYGNRSGGYAAVGFSVLLAAGAALMTLPIKAYDMFGIAILGAFNLWPTLATLLGAKRMNQQQASVKQEIALKGSALGRILFGAMYLLAFLTVLFGIIGIVSI